ncbi:MAG TPA: DHA2 family efflux MFS transporter permease subunit [Stellaceae bacterium]|nr:DHA2 family efflux MFS transporter permease subunit [Stellaceae bacterium]
MNAGPAPQPRAAMPPDKRRGWIAFSIMLPRIMQGIDTTIANVALPYIGGNLSASQTQAAWVLTSYIVAAAIMMPLSGWLAGRFGIKYIYLLSVAGFTLASALCGSATGLTELVLYRALQGICGAGMVPLSQAVLLQTYPVERHGQAMAIFGIGTIVGPITGPVLGGWLTENYSWRWIFYINLPVGVIAALGILFFIPETRRAHREAFDFFGFITLSVAVGAFQILLDRGEMRGWFGATEIWIEAAIAAVALYLFVVHTMTVSGPSFLNRDLLKSPNYMAGIVLMFFLGGIMNGTLALLPTMLQSLLNYPVITAGIVTAPRAFGTMVAMFVVARLINRIDGRLLILFGLVMTAAAQWQMTGFSLGMGMEPVILSGLTQGFGIGCIFVPLNTLALSNLPRHILTQGTALRSLLRNIGGSVGIAIFEAQIVQNTQVVHSRLVEALRPDNPLAQPPFLPAPYSLTAPSGITALNAEVTRQAEMVAYIDDFKLMMIIALCSMVLLLLVRRPRAVRAAAPAE